MSVTPSCHFATVHMSLCPSEDFYPNSTKHTRWGGRELTFHIALNPMLS